MTWVIVAAYLIGGLIGYSASRIDALGRVWPTLVRAQLLTASVALALTAAWRLNGFNDVLWPVLLILPMMVLLVIALVFTKGQGRLGRGTLRAWTAGANCGFFAIPVAAALVGASGVVVAVLIDRLGAPLWALYIWLLRKDAPRPQTISTSWIDQSPLIALFVGLALRTQTPAPEWTATVSGLAAPVMALTGAALFVGSVLHSTQRINPKPGVKVWLALSVLRVGFYLPLIWLAPTTPIRVVAVLCALTIPTFGPPQMSTVYGYADPVVAAGSRYGWAVGALGLAVAVGLSR